MSGKLEKLLISMVKHDQQQKLLSIEVAFNPTSIKEEQEVRFREEQVVGSVQRGKQFSSIPPSTLTFDFTLDGTGANKSADEKVVNVLDSVNTIRKITQEYNGVLHEPPWVEVSWGTNVVKGRTTHLGVEYTLFKSSGEPLRAEVSIAIERSLTRDEELKKKNMSSPDLTHIVSVQSGDTLPLLCHRIYGDSRYYIDIVKHNKLSGFRNLVPGTELHFPPLR